jgi:hypothetical protein
MSRFTKGIQTMNSSNTPELRDIKSELAARVQQTPGADDTNLRQLPAPSAQFPNVHASTGTRPDGDGLSWFPYVGVEEYEVSTADDARQLAAALNEVALQVAVMNSERAIEVPADRLSLEKWDGETADIIRFRSPGLNGTTFTECFADHDRRWELDGKEAGYAWATPLDRYGYGPYEFEYLGRFRCAGVQERDGVRHATLVAS